MTPHLQTSRRPAVSRCIAEAWRACVRFTWQAPFIGLIASMIAGLLLGTAAWAQPAQFIGRDFDHLRTGFALSGAHTNARCESCHLGGVFKGTPRD